MDNDIEPILETDIITKILEKIVSNNCVLLLEEPDCRKSTLLHKIASCSEDHLKYNLYLALNHLTYLIIKMSQRQVHS